MSKVEFDPFGGCWLYCGTHDRSGYGVVGRTQFKSSMAHRLAFELWVRKLRKNEKVLHRCDVRCCINPAHLFGGTQKQNIRDCRKKGRMWNGAKKGQGLKLTPTDVLAIRADARPASTIAAEYGLHMLTVYSVKKRRIWKNI